MREVLNISMPKKMADRIRQEVKKGEFSSISEYFRSLIRKEKQEDLLRELIKSEKEIKQGKVKELKFLDDLK